MQVGDIMHKNVVTVGAEETFAHAAEILHRHRISSVVVKSGGGSPAS